jgi:endoglucanase
VSGVFFPAEKPELMRITRHPDPKVPKAGLLANCLIWAACAAPAFAAAPANELTAWQAARQMGLGVNIGNTLENTTAWETGWGNPRVTKEYVEKLAALGFKTVRLPVAWDTYARDGKLDPAKLERVAEVVDWILGAGMFCVVNIHWDGGWIDSSNKEKFAATYATFSADAQRKFESYWQQIATHLGDRGEKLVYEGLNEETHFENEGSTSKAYAALARVNQLFIDTVRNTGGANAHRLLIITGYGTDFEKTTNGSFVLPKDTLPGKLLLSVHYYTPWTFAGLEKDESWGKMQREWGSAADIREMSRLFGALQEYCKRHDLPAFIGEFAPTTKRDAAQRVIWMYAVAANALKRDMVPVLWETGGDISRRPPYQPSAALREVLNQLRVR